MRRPGEEEPGNAPRRVTMRRPGEEEPGDLHAAEHWFLSQGLPAVLPRDALLRGVWSRSAPALAGLAAMAVNSVIVVRLTGHQTVDINGRPSISEGFALALLTIALPGAALTGWLVSRLATRGRVVAGLLATVLVGVGILFGGPGPHVPARVMLWAGALGLILLLTASGAGAILGWSARATLTNLTLVAGMFVRALPVVLLTFLVFFNTYVWLMAAVISRGRLWLAVGFLFVIAGAFLVSGTLDRVRPMLAAPSSVTEEQAELAGTPFQHMSEPPHSPPLSHRERINVVFVVATSQLGQVLTAAALTGAIFFAFGLILLSPELLDAWTRNEGSHDGRLLGMTLPVPDPLIQTSLLLTAITFMYLSAKAVTDREYREAFVDPLVADLQRTLLARDRYRAALGSSGFRKEGR
ncbi:MAG: hypothetical protein ACKOQ4_00825 [Mycobacterium sp.]